MRASQCHQLLTRYAPSMISKRTHKVIQDCFLQLFLLCGVSFSSVVAAETRIEQLCTDFCNDDAPVVLVVAHRGVHSLKGEEILPENSLPAIKKAISLGVDIVEVDLQLTKDGHLVLMHDSKVDRTTNGTGKVAELTLVEVRSLRLTLNGETTQHRVPTLQEAMNACKDKILINLDHAEDYLDETIKVLLRTETVELAILKGMTTSPDDVPVDASFKAYYMPKFVVGDYLTPFLRKLKPEAVEIKFGQSSELAEFKRMTAESDAAGARVWVNSLNPGHFAGKTDEQALKNPEDVWGVMIASGANVIQTDEPELLLGFLRKKALRRGAPKQHQ